MRYKTFNAVLARRLLFTTFEIEYMGLISEITEDLKSAKSMRPITGDGLAYFWQFFGLDSGSLHPVFVDPFRKPALWGCPGWLGVAACSNHCGDFHAGSMKQSATCAIQYTDSLAFCVWSVERLIDLI
jgi:hypothetical protein